MKHIEIRNRFLNFFESKGHRIVPSDSLVPAGDTTLLFTSAGMTQFKDEFMGNIKDFTRAATCQKCMRTADLENVGRTSYHHSFFEMLGNFSFGDYFKKDAISWAWEFLTKELKIEEKRLWVSVYEEDSEAYDIWKDSIKIPESRIVKLGQKDNFWPSEAKDKGPNGPCGPCSEIYYDYGENQGCADPGCSPACGCARFVEVWNLVFTQFDRKDAGLLEPLPKKNIDTGMGLERLCAVIQGVHNNFETDLFTPIIEAINKEMDASADIARPPLTENPAPPAGRPACRKGRRKPSLCAIADHIRAVTFAIADGITPSNEERGYVIRNILRKALLHAIDLGAQEPVLYKLVYSVANTMQEQYPEILKRHQDISGIIKFEEERFFNTLSQGKRLLDDIIEDAKKNKENVITGQTAFKLFDTHGLPLIIIKELSAREGFAVDEKAFNALMESQREQSRKSSNLSGTVFVDTGIKEKTIFAGYNISQSKAKVLRIMLPNGTDIGYADNSVPMIEIILDVSVFYPQQGGQEPDKGRIFSADMQAKVLYAKKIQDAILLDVEILNGTVSIGDIVDTLIDVDRRTDIAKNHTATHLLQSALRKTLGEHVQQQGSFVDQDRLRFDFTHFKALTDDELGMVEAMVNEYINQSLHIHIEEMPLNQAKLTGALSFFGEKYGQHVRVIKAGDKSIELCGGTHVGNTSEIELFRIMREGSVASGIRRIEAVTSKAASLWEKERYRHEREKQVILQKKQDDKIMAKAIIKQAESEVDAIIDSAEKIDDIVLVIKCTQGQNIDVIKRVSDALKRKAGSEYVIFMAALEGKKASILITVSNKLLGRGIDAARLLSSIVKPFSGSGGGRPDMAQGGIKDLTSKDELLKSARDIILKELA
jgi:alanyl-tRNA synthetase